MSKKFFNAVFTAIVLITIIFLGTNCKNNNESKIDIVENIYETKIENVGEQTRIRIPAYTKDLLSVYVVCTAKLPRFKDPDLTKRARQNILENICQMSVKFAVSNVLYKDLSSETVIPHIVKNFHKGYEDYFISEIKILDFDHVLVEDLHTLLKNKEDKKTGEVINGKYFRHYSKDGVLFDFSITFITNDEELLYSDETTMRHIAGKFFSNHTYEEITGKYMFVDPLKNMLERKGLKIAHVNLRELK